MLSLAVYTANQHHLVFASHQRPLRPSSIPKLFKCPMSVFMANADDDESNAPADTGSLVHAGAAAFHKTDGDVQFRKEAGDNAIETSLPLFPRGDRSKALTIFAAYAADPTNQNAVVPWVEEKVTLTLAPSPCDPTQEPIVISGTLDQVRLDGDTLCVWDIKTGSGKDANETNAEYVLQQCVYTMAARETLNPDILPGGFIYTPGYDKPRGRRFLPLGLSIEQCKTLLAPLPRIVSLIRQGVPLFMPSAGACQYCPVRPYTNCLTMYQGVFS